MELFGRYRLLRKIAAGGMGEIFLARSASLDGFEKDLVIKRILPVHGANERFVSMFLDEARVTMSLSHQNVVQVFDFGEAEGRYYLAMEHVHGCDLRALLKLPRIANEGLPHGLALWIIREVARGLDYAHHKRDKNGTPLHLIHRDVSADNVLLSLDGGVKLTDFGIARAAGQATSVEPGMIVGKIHYMAPEIANGDAPDPRSDVFSAGALLWELLVGRRMYFQPENEPNMMFYARVCSARIEKPSVYNAKVSRRLEEIVMRAVSERPDDRHPSARALAEEIHEELTARHRDADGYALERFLAGLRPELGIVGFEDVEDPGGAAPARKAAVPVAEEPEPPEPPVDAHADDGATIDLAQPIESVPEVLELAEGFRAKPSVWQLLRMGDASAEAGQHDHALACYRVAAVKFAQHGLLAQALLSAKLMLEQSDRGALLQEIAALPTLAGLSDERIVPYFFRSGGPLEQLLAEILAGARSARGVSTDTPPLLSALGPRGFAKLAKLAPLQRFSAEQVIVEQGEQSETMYLLLSGRVLVQVKRPSGRRVNVATMAAGDIFGESSFFSGAPRNATVQAAEDGALIEIDPPLYDRVMSGSPKAASLLQRFYKERILDRLLATSSTFGLLSPSERRELLGKISLRSFEPGFQIYTRGAPVRAVVVIKRGSVEMRDGSGVGPIAQSAGSILGAEEALSGAPSALSVVSAGEVEAFVLRATDLLEVVERQEGRKERWLERASARDSIAP